MGFDAVSYLMGPAAGGGGGSAPAPSLPYSDSTKIAVSANQAGYSDGASSWDGLVCRSTKKAEDSVLVPYEGLLKYNLGANNTSFTLYLVARAISTGAASSGHYYMIANVEYSAAEGNSVLAVIDQHLITTAIWGRVSEMRTSVPAYDRFVLAMSVDAVNKTAHWSVNGTTNDGTFRNSGRYIRIGASTDANDESSIVLADFVGIVSESESSSVVAQNVSHLMTLYGISAA